MDSVNMINLYQGLGKKREENTSAKSQFSLQWVKRKRLVAMDTDAHPSD